ncbi:MAG: hypothetical protein AB1478_11370 [Nitrospirota bacterium]
MRFKLFLLFLLILSACAKKEVLRYIPPQLPVEEVSTEALLKRTDFSNLNTVKASVKLDIQHKEQSKGTFSGVLLYSHPDRLNLRIFGPFGLTVMEALFLEGTLQVLITPTDTLYSGTTPFDTLLPDHDSFVNSIKFLEEMDNAYILYIAGAVQTDISPRHTKGLENELEKGGVRGFDSDLTLKAKYFFSKADLSLNAVELYAGGKKQVRIVRIEIYRTEGLVPSDVGIRIKDAFFHLELKDIEINKDLKDDCFSPLEASHKLPLSRFLRILEPNQ